MIIRDHYGATSSSTHDPARMIHHGEMDIEANLFTMMTAVACYPKG
jgi:hypothetical protein